MLSSIWESVSGLAPLVSGNCCVKQINGPKAQSNESNKTERLPETAIWPSCSFKRSPMIVKLSPSNLRWAATSIGCVPMTLYIPVPITGSLTKSLLVRFDGGETGTFPTTDGTPSWIVFFAEAGFVSFPLPEIQHIQNNLLIYHIEYLNKIHARDKSRYNYKNHKMDIYST